MEITIFNKGVSFNTASYTIYIILTFFPKLNERSPRQGSSDLQSFRHDGGGDQFILRYFFVQFLVSAFVEQNLVVQLVTNFSFGPLLQVQNLYISKNLAQVYGSL